ncbi:MAG: RNA polymerase factor sigma-54 [Caldiserica bacterium]|nr:RNA polymerase factor sigma-54 [Caldisericota bacterium]MDH7562736.1 RNA polymerase factor sigma-54 [Caldisericota bacterium]
MNIPLRPDLSQVQQQQLRLSPKLQQSVLILELPLAELREFINKELEENPLLEEETTPNEQDLQEDFGVEGAQSERGFLQIQAPEPDLHTYLRLQLGMHLSSLEDLSIGEEIIDCIDDDGYLRIPPREIARRLKVEEKRVKEVLEIIKTFEPTGVGARDLKECLLIQLEEKGEASPLLKELIQNHLPLLSRRSQWKKLSQTLKCSLKELQDAFQKIRMLEPKPGRLFSSSSPSYIIPDLVVKKVQGELSVFSNKDYLPRLTLSQTYRELLKDDQAGKFLRKKLSSAKWIIRCIEKRTETLEKVAGFLVKRQEDFFEFGEAKLKPLSLAEVGKALGMHESTISRAIRGKYVDTPLGVFPLKVFLTGNTSKKAPGLSEAFIKEEVKKILKEESKEKPYSDEEITLLLKERGISISRRTVTKYRLELGIPSKSHRKE